MFVRYKSMPHSIECRQRSVHWYKRRIKENEMRERASVCAVEKGFYNVPVKRAIEGRKLISERSLHMIIHVCIYIYIFMCMYVCMYTYVLALWRVLAGIKWGSKNAEKERVEAFTQRTYILCWWLQCIYIYIYMIGYCGEG